LIFEDLSEKERKRIPPAEEKIQLEENTASRLSLFRGLIQKIGR